VREDHAESIPAGGGQPAGARRNGDKSMGGTDVGGPVELLMRDGPDLAPEILRRRLVVEGTCPRPIDADAIVRYLNGLSDVCQMSVLLAPVTHRSDRYGWAGWVHWEASGAHFYAWEQPRVFFSVDIYACAPFSSEEVAGYTRRFFDATELVAFQY
jgi:S-adenosylmethionine decarboxylase